MLVIAPVRPDPGEHGRESELSEGPLVCELSNRAARFMTNVYPPRAAAFEALAGGQSPRALFITCSDSRISPNLITQTEPGELFVIRNAGNMVPPSTAAVGGEAATLEYAVLALRVPDIIVCGHSHCGAMAAALDPASAASLRCVSSWITNATPAVERLVGTTANRLDALIEKNVLLQLENLRSYDFVRAAESAGDLTLHGWVYRFERGEIVRYDREEGSFEPLVATDA